MSLELSQLKSLQESTTTSSRPIASSPQQREDTPMKNVRSEPVQTDLIATEWKDHVDKIESELQALKSALSSVAVTVSNSRSASQGQEDSDERMLGIVQENRRLRLSNKKLTQELLDMAQDDIGNFCSFQWSKTISFALIPPTFANDLTADHILSFLQFWTRVQESLQNKRRFYGRLWFEWV